MGVVVTGVITVSTNDDIFIGYCLSKGIPLKGLSKKLFVLLEIIAGCHF
ncbi:hypothetical protein PROVRUST_06873 [Providencia rustigianii DSM 4541]|uniref:Uncharacterized protein n=1 Tax=Providencia rustigianii DSM 4541 TaxID=500637 RepID=D1P3K2_9GAMM|nr:hypothetical protein PROVRUST_06873 [Providencia rustigianii DSM 4541]